MNKLTKLILVLFLLWTIDCGLWTFSYAEVPHLINYQGKLTDKDSKPLEGAHAITFRIYDALSGGNLLWQETQNVTIQKGIFNVLLGSSANLNLPFDKPYFLEIKVGSEVMSPRQRIASAGYAMRAESVDSLPTGVILMCKDSCPTGYKRIGALDGKFLVGGTSYNSNAGGSNTHTHGAGSYKGSVHAHQFYGPDSWSSGTHGNWRGFVGKSGSSSSWFTESDGGGSVTGTSASADSRPAFATVVLCEKE